MVAFINPFSRMASICFMSRSTVSYGRSPWAACGSWAALAPTEQVAHSGEKRRLVLEIAKPFLRRVVLCPPGMRVRLIDVDSQDVCFGFDFYALAIDGTAMRNGRHRRRHHEEDEQHGLMSISGIISTSSSPSSYWPPVEIGFDRLVGLGGVARMLRLGAADRARTGLIRSRTVGRASA
jgi:hypothetical protein